MCDRGLRIVPQSIALVWHISSQVFAMLLASKLKALSNVFEKWRKKNDIYTYALRQLKFRTKRFGSKFTPDLTMVRDSDYDRVTHVKSILTRVRVYGELLALAPTLLART